MYRRNMANKTPRTPPPSLTKKHQAKLQREQMWRRWLIIGTAIVVVLVIGILLYGLVFQSVIQANQPIASVDKQNISTRSWQDRVRFQRANLLSNAQQTFQFAQAFTDPSFQSSFASQLQQIKLQLDSVSLGTQILNTMVDDLVIQKEAAKKGIAVSEPEVRKRFEETFGYYLEGTPTEKPTEAPIPTSTLNPLQLTLIPPTATPQPTTEPTNTPEAAPTEIPAANVTPTATLILPTPTTVTNPTATALPTATANTVEGSGYYTQTVDNFKTNFGMNEATFRDTLLQIIRAQLYREKVEEAVYADANISRTEPQVWARHILVADEQTAKDIYTRIQNGEDFCALAAEFSTDESNKATCGDLSWFSKDQMAAEFEKAAFALKVGEVSQPVKTSFGYHIIQSLGNEERPLSDSAFQSLQLTTFQDWLDARKGEYTIVMKDDLIAERVPTEPAWPAIFDTFITQAQQQVPTPVVEVPTPAP